ncbi:hypothetical protein [Glycomyces arizonensis]|uniref:hypothetical protein n=1 Tax=Glycomyces arizonensis TaxID=256035 RepID=UPI000413DC63|nr:hypothetical protein [Glycomyces arizonensis]
MSTTEPPVSLPRREALRTGWVVLLSLLTLIPLAVWDETREPDSPVEIVEAFLEAVHDKDLDRAFGYIDGSIPVGEEAAFLHPDAIDDDWEVLDLTESEGRYSSETVVRVTIGHPDGTAEGRFIVEEFDDELTIQDPFQPVTFAASSQLELQVNDRVVERVAEAPYQDLIYAPNQRYELLPGIYRFFGSEPVALLDADETEAITVGAPDAEPTPEQIAAVQAAVNERIDACVEYRLPDPPGCPFSTDGQVDTVDHQRVEDIEDLVWTVSEYPKVTVAPGIDLYSQPALVVTFDEPGRLELQGTGTTDFDHWNAFTAACHFGGGELVVLLRGDDAVELAPLGVTETDTCRGTE